MNREITVTYSRDLIKLAIWKFWTRSIGVTGFVGFVIICFAFFYFLISGDRSWLLGFLGAVAGISFALGAVSYIVYSNRSMEKFRQMGQPTAKFRFTDDRIGIESDIGWTELSWKMIENIWKYPSVWLVFIAKQGYITLPTADLDEELRKFIEVKTEASHTKETN